MRLIDADELKAKVEAMVEHKVQESDYDYSRNQTLDYMAEQDEAFKNKGGEKHDYTY